MFEHTDPYWLLYWGSWGSWAMAVALGIYVAVYNLGKASKEKEKEPEDTERFYTLKRRYNNLLMVLVVYLAYAFRVIIPLRYDMELTPEYVVRALQGRAADIVVVLALLFLMIRQEAIVKDEEQVRRRLEGDA